MGAGQEVEGVNSISLRVSFFLNGSKTFSEYPAADLASRLIDQVDVTCLEYNINHLTKGMEPWNLHDCLRSVVFTADCPLESRDTSVPPVD